MIKEYIKIPTYLVLSGGIQSCLNIIGNLHILEENNYLQLDKLKTIYATSSGSFIAILLVLKKSFNYDWNTILNYIFNRPWHEVFHISIEKLFNAFNNCGIYGREQIEQLFLPLF